MGVRVLENREGTEAVLYCSTSGVAFGPVFCETYLHEGLPDEEYISAGDVAHQFLRHLKGDARNFSNEELSTAYGRFDPHSPDLEGCEDCEGGSW